MENFHTWQVYHFVETTKLILEGIRKHLLYSLVPSFSGLLIFMDTLINLCYFGIKKKRECNGNTDISLTDSILPNSTLINTSLAKRPGMN